MSAAPVPTARVRASALPGRSGPAGLLDAAGGPALWCRSVRRAVEPLRAVDAGVALCARTPRPPALVTRPLLGDTLYECTDRSRAPATPVPPVPEQDPPRAPAGPDTRRETRPAPRRADEDASKTAPSTAGRPRGPARPGGPRPVPHPPRPPRGGPADGAVGTVLRSLARQAPSSLPAAPAGAPSVRAPRTQTAPDGTSAPSRPRSPLPAESCGDDLAAQTAGRVARTLGAADLSGLTTSRVRRVTGDPRTASALRTVLDRLTGRLQDAGVADRQQGGPPGSTDRGSTDPGSTRRTESASPVLGLPPASGRRRRRRDRPATEGADATAPRAGRDGAGGPAGSTDARRGRGSPASQAGDGRPRRPGRSGGDTGEGTDAVLRAPDRGSPPWAGTHDRSVPASRQGPGELPDRPGRLVALGGAGLDDTPHDGSTTGAAPSALAGTLGTTPQPTVWDSSGIGGAGGAVPAVSAPVLERLLERVLDDAARRHGIEV
ncbi:hypothetical protein [Sanguibacter sp. 25GB23B1]|uniref:hypothetical protein n=1 Tax=unclassified Sanguibacter TaxID=2645534 RepID=UPI0032AF2712